MKINLKLLVIIIAIGTLITSCNKEKTLQNTKVSNKYYQSEIFAENDTKIYGKWRIQSVHGSFCGTGFLPYFDVLVFEKYGIYKLYHNDTLWVTGKVNHEVQTTQFITKLIISFQPDISLNADYFSAFPKTVITLNSDTLHMQDPCCDLYEYLFTRIK